jgi:hypothetical protein
MMTKILSLDYHRLIENPLLKIPMVLILGYYIGKTMVYPQPFIWLLAISFLISFVVFKKPKAGIFILIISVFFLDWLEKSYFFLPRQITWLKDVTILLLLLRSLTLIVFRKEVKRTPIDLFLLAFIGVGIISAILNSVSPAVMILGMRKPLKYLLLFYVIVHSDFDESFFKMTLKILLIIAFLQIPVSIAEFFIWTPEMGESLGSGMGEFDFVTGTLPRGASGILALLLLTTMSFFLGMSLYTRQSKFFWASLLFLLPLPLTMSRFSFFLLPVLFLYLLRKNLTYQFSRRLLYTVFLTLFFIGIVLSSSITANYDLKRYLLHPQEVVEKQSLSVEKTGESGRIGSIQYVVNNLQSVPNGLLLGVGPGMWSESFFSQYSSQLFEISSVSHANQYAATMSEFGLLGLIIYILIIFKIFLMNNQFFKISKDPFWKSISFGFSGMIIIFLLGGMYIPLWHSDALAFCFWSIAGIIYVTGTRKSFL